MSNLVSSYFNIYVEIRHFTAKDLLILSIILLHTIDVESAGFDFFDFSMLWHCLFRSMILIFQFVKFVSISIATVTNMYTS